MQAFISKFIAFFMAILSFFGINIKGSTPVEKTDDIIITGNRIEFVMHSNPSTGYSWRYTLSNDNVAFVEENFVSDPHPEEMVGVGGQTHIIFEAQKPGDTHIVFEYVSPGSDKKVAKTIKADVIVYDDLNISMLVYE